VLYSNVELPGFRRSCAVSMGAGAPGINSISRVVTMVFCGNPAGSYTTDPLAAGVEHRRKHGLVVFAAAGNGGPARGTVEVRRSPRISSVWIGPPNLHTPAPDLRPWLRRASPGSSQWGTPTRLDAPADTGLNRY